MVIARVFRRAVVKSLNDQMVYVRSVTGAMETCRTVIARCWSKIDSLLWIASCCVIQQPELRKLQELTRSSMCRAGGVQEIVELGCVTPWLC